MRWSYSKLSVYENCPRQFKYKYIDKIDRFVESPAMVRGLDIHNKAEKYATGQIKRMPKELKVYENEFNQIRKMGASGEVDYSFTEEWEPTKWNKWSNVWCIAKVDTRVEITKENLAIIDYKTGKIYDTHKDQADVYALSGFIHYPEVEDIDLEFWYLDQKDEDPGSWGYSRDTHFKPLQRMFQQRHDKMAKDKKFIKKPTYKCRWCDYNSKNGGPCDRC